MATTNLDTLDLKTALKINGTQVLDTTQVAGVATAGQAEVLDGNKSMDVEIVRTYILQGAAAVVGGAGTAYQIIKQVAAIADNTFTDAVTVTIPNAAHDAFIFLQIMGTLGAGGAIGAGEGSAGVTAGISISRTAGVATVAVVSTVSHSAQSNVAGGATATVTLQASAMTGAVGAQQTFTIQVKIARGSGASTNHVATVQAEVINQNATGVTIA